MPERMRAYSTQNSRCSGRSTVGFSRATSGIAGMAASVTTATGSMARAFSSGRTGWGSVGLSAWLGPKPKNETTSWLILLTPLPRFWSWLSTDAWAGAAANSAAANTPAMERPFDTRNPTHLFVTPVFRLLALGLRIAPPTASDRPQLEQVL